MQKMSSSFCLVFFHFFANQIISILLLPSGVLYQIVFKLLRLTFQNEYDIYYYLLFLYFSELFLMSVNKVESEVKKLSSEFLESKSSARIRKGKSFIHIYLVQKLKVWSP